MLKEIQVKILSVMDSHSFDNLSFKKIGELVGIQHAQSVIYHLQRLEQLGFIEADWKKRTFKKIKDSAPLESMDNIISIPICGTANCGVATFYAEQHIDGYLTISKSMLRGFSTKELFAIKADGDSMNRANINGDSIEGGDYVLINKNFPYIKNGDYVLSIIDGMANIKKFFREKTGNVILSSESTKNYHPIYVTPEDSKYIVNGIVVKVIKIGKNIK